MDRSRDLLIDAEDFLGTARDLMEKGRWSKVCFNAQQAAELALKAVLQRMGVERRTHSLVDLLRELVTHLPESGRFWDDVKILDQYYIPTRYANAFASGPAKDKYTENQARDAVERAKRIIEWAGKHVL
ncbi:HEPN domain-containing protein [Candidatus Caldarchaeum subterraneum]|uniref:HEPN domain-containing protein n=1 Tax=Caldiarchaeum subterraneum TaxID=311458 RepID=E6N6V4_CALS0|nr:HEPN domain-containing protein [Candidatus Caldarchaeum subterraneum]BAJ50823.1 HEPN domain-containing protein [Candidatus Caldarchaeum subterraneum]